MATEYVDVTVLDVGQGMGTFVEVYDKADNLISTLLFDLGSEHFKDEAGKPSADYIVKKLKFMTDPVIDFLMLSHKDSDHVNLIQYLLQQFPTPTDLTINRVYYTGSAKWYPKGLLTSLEKYTLNGKADVTPFLVYDTGYKKNAGGKKTWNSLYNSDDVKVYLLVANTPVGGAKPGAKASTLPEKPSDNAANTMSSVVAVEYKDKAFIIAGDATYNTLCAIVNIFDDVTNLGDISMLTIPHHGSRKTTFGLSSTDAVISTKKMDAVKEFVDLVQAKSLTVSADRKFYHPSLQTMQIFWPYANGVGPWYSDCEPVLLAKKLHTISAAVDTGLKQNDGSVTAYDYWSFQTSVNIYSTLYSMGIDKTEFIHPPDPAQNLYSGKIPKKFPLLPEGVSWCFRVQKNGTLALDKFTNRELMAVGALAVKPKGMTAQAGLQTVTPSIQGAANPTSTFTLPGAGAPGMPPPRFGAPRPSLMTQAPILTRLYLLR